MDRNTKLIVQNLDYGTIDDRMLARQIQAGDTSQVYFPLSFVLEMMETVRHEHELAS